MGREDCLRSELGLLTDEYKALKAEIVANLNSARQISGLAFAAIGALIAGGRFLVESGRADLFLIAPIFFYALAWAQLRYVFLVLDMGAHLRCIVAPRVRQILVDLAELDEHSFDHLLSWENRGRSPVRGRSNRLLKLLFIPIAGANFGIPLLASVSSIIAFFVFRNSDVRLTSGELTLLVINVLALLYGAAWGAVAERAR